MPILEYYITFWDAYPGVLHNFLRCLSLNIKREVSSGGFQTASCCCSLWLMFRQNWCRWEMKTCLSNFAKTEHFDSMLESLRVQSFSQQPNAGCSLCLGQVEPTPDIIYQNGCFSFSCTGTEVRTADLRWSHARHKPVFWASPELL